jgi:hypothetical protein
MRLILLGTVFAVVAAGVAGSGTMHAHLPQGQNGAAPAAQAGATQVAALQAPPQPDRARLADQPAPRTSDGRIVIGGTPTQRGVWIGGNLGFCNANRVAAPTSLNPGATGAPGAARGAAPAQAGRAGGRGSAGAAPCTPIPYRDWTLAVSDDRRRNELEPHTRCKPSGGPRQWLTPYGAEFVELPEQRVAYIFDIGGPHTYRTIYMDGRAHPENPTPSFYGHSIGWWEGDTLVVDTVGFNEGFWLDRGQLPHTERLHLLERYTRTSLTTMRYELTIDDPGAYSAPFTGTSNLRWEAGTELFEYVCQQGNQAYTLMVGDGTSADRSSPIVP